MKSVLVGLLFVSALSAPLAHAQLSAVAPAGTQSVDRTSEQVNACHDKVSDLSNQLAPLQKKRSGLWSERKTFGTSGGDSAKYKLLNIDHEIAQVTKQIDGVTRQIDSEKKRCDDLAAKPSSQRSGAQAAPSVKPKGNGGRH